MGCTQDREKQRKKISVINKSISYLMPELCRSVEQAQICVYNKYSPVQISPVVEIVRVGNIMIYGKMENIQLSGSLKLRGAYNKIYKVLDKALFFEEQDRVRIVTSSMGNHGIACVEAFNQLKKIKKFEGIFKNLQAKKNEEILLQSPPDKKQLEIDSSQISQFQDTPTDGGDWPDLVEGRSTLNSKAVVADHQCDITIFVPKTCLAFKSQQLEKMPGVQVIQKGEDYIDAEKEARQFAFESGSNFISPYNDVDVIGGASTIGFEIEQWCLQKKLDLDYIFVTVGGGALAAGLGIYLKYMKMLNIKIIGVQHQLQCDMYRSVQQQIVYAGVSKLQTISDSTVKGFEATSLCFPLCQALVDDWVLVSEEEIKTSLYQLVQKGIVVEGIISSYINLKGSAAMAYAGCLKHLDKLQSNSDQTIFINQEESKITSMLNCMVILGGQNVEMKTIQEILIQKEAVQKG